MSPIYLDEDELDEPVSDWEARHPELTCLIGVTLLLAVLVDLVLLFALLGGGL